MGNLILIPRTGNPILTPTVTVPAAKINYVSVRRTVLSWRYPYNVRVVFSDGRNDYKSTYKHRTWETAVQHHNNIELQMKNTNVVDLKPLNLKNPDV
jgi:hypothetical protein